MIRHVEDSMEEEEKTLVGQEERVGKKFKACDWGVESKMECKSRGSSQHR